MECAGKAEGVAGALDDNALAEDKGVRTLRLAFS